MDEDSVDDAPVDASWVDDEATAAAEEADTDI
jgi:hypothetical protein